MKIFITGSEGYVGRVLTASFLKEGIPVCGLDLNINKGERKKKGYTLYHGSVTDEEKISSLLENEKPTHVIHCAYLMSPLHDTVKNHTIDVKGTESVFTLSSRNPSVKHFILMSSTSAYGAWPDNTRWIKEARHLRPGDYRYGIHKMECEKFCRCHAKQSDMKLVILRMCTLVGPSYHKKGGVVALLAKSPLLPKFNGRFCELQFIHEDDLRALFMKIIHDPEIEGTFNLAPDSYSTVDQLAPRPFYLNIPLSVARTITAILWKLRLSDTMPGALDLTTWGIIASPERIQKRYRYTFRHSTSEAFQKAVSQRKAAGTL